MKKIFTLFAALAMVMSMSAVNMTGGEELYLTPNSNWLQHGDGKAPRFAIYVYGSGGDAWASMTAVEGESKLYKAVVPNGNWTNVIFCRMNGNKATNGWDAKYNQTDNLTYNGTQNWYTVKDGTWDKGGGTWALYAPEAPKSYKDITITIVANATPKIHYWDGGDKMVGTVWENLPEMTATGEANTYSCTIKDVDEAIGVKYLIKVGEVQSADQQAFNDVKVNFKDLLPQVVVMGVTGWTGDKMTVSDDYLSASITLSLAANKAYDLKLTVNGEWFGGKTIAITKDKNSAKFDANGDGNGKITTDLAGDYVFTYTYATKTLVVTYPEPEPELEVMDIEMTNLVVEEMEDFVVLTASDDSNTGLNVMLAVNEDGSLAADSYMAMVQGWSEVELPIVEGKITKAYNEELATDVYSGLVVVEYMEGKLGLNLTMYAKPVVATDVVVTDATITVETKDDGVGGTYEIINIAANWNGSVLEIEGVEKEFEGFVQIKQVIDEATDDWYIWMCMNGVITTVDNVLTVTGEFKNNWTGDVYNVTISGTLPVEKIAYELNGGEFPAVVVPTNEELALVFKQEYAEYFAIEGLTDTDMNREVGNFIYVTNSKGGDAIKFITENANWKWLHDYILTVAGNIPEGTNVGYYWRANLDGFFHCKNAVAVGGVASADYTEAGKPEAWGAAYQAAHAVVLPTEPVDAPYTLPTPVKEGYKFVGWYDKAEGTGEPYTVIPAGWSGTLYAIWEAEGPATALDNIAIEGKVVKTIINGQLIIVKDGVQYNAQGAVIK